MQRIKRFLSEYTIIRRAGIELSLITLKINDKEVHEDYTQEKILKQNVPVYWVNMFILVFNIAFNYYDYLTGGATSTFQIIRGGSAFCMTVVSYAFCYFKCRKFSRLTFMIVQIVYSLLTLFGAKSANGDILFT